MVTCEASQRALFPPPATSKQGRETFFPEFNFQLKKIIPHLELIFKAHLISPYSVREHLIIGFIKADLLKSKSEVTIRQTVLLHINWALVEKKVN